MIRLVVILLLATTGLLRFPHAAGGAHGACAHPGCAIEIETRSGCCDLRPAAAEFCPMSGGPCQCGVSPRPDPQPNPDAPLPRTDRDSLTAVPAPPIRVESWAEPPLSAATPPDGYVRYALYHSPAVEAAYQRWAAVSERLPQVRALPDPRLNFGFFLDEVETRTGPQQARFGVSQSFPWPGLLEA